MDNRRNLVGGRGGGGGANSTGYGGMQQQTQVQQLEQKNKQMLHDSIRQLSETQQI